MTQSRRRVAMAAVAASVVAGVSLTPWLYSPAGASPVAGTVTSVGWWTSRATASPQPAGGFEVASGPDGSAQSVAAMNVNVDIATLSALHVTLTESTSVGNQLAHLRVCLAAPGWTPANPGALADAPTMDCATKVELVHTNHRTWEGDISPLIPQGGTASLGVVAVSDSPAPVGTGLVVDVASVALRGDGTIVDRTVVPPPSASTDFPSAPDNSYIVDTPIINLDPGSRSNPGNGFEIPSSSASAANQTAGSRDLTSTTKPAAGRARPWFRLLFLVPLSALVGIGSVYGQRVMASRGVSLS